MKKVIEINNLNVFYGNTSALTDVSLDVLDGEYLAIIGPNGGGKTTLLNSIVGLVKPTKGDVKICNGSIKEKRSHIGYVPQIAVMDRKYPITVIETVMTALLKNGLHPFARFSKEDKAYAMQMLERVGIEKLAKRQISELSGGEFQRLLIARALAVNPHILILDEPTASVDPASRMQIYELLSNLNNSGMTVVMVTHDMLAISSSINKLACINNNLIYFGEPKLTDDVCTAMYGCGIDLVSRGIPQKKDKNYNKGGKTSD